MDISTVKMRIIENQRSRMELPMSLLYSNYLNINRNDLFTYIVILVTDLYISEFYIFIFYTLIHYDSLSCAHIFVTTTHTFWKYVLLKIFLHLL